MTMAWLSGKDQDEKEKQLFLNFWQKASAKVQSPPQELEEDPRSWPYVLVAIKRQTRFGILVMEMKRVENVSVHFDVADVHLRTL